MGVYTSGVMLDAAVKKSVVRRLRRMHGQLAGLIRMVEQEDGCVDVLLQLSAVAGALRKTAQLVLAAHIETCVRSAFTDGSEADRQQNIDELLLLFDRYGGRIK